MSAHTPEPWTADEWCASVLAGDQLIADMAVPSEHRDACPRDQLLPNAIRIAACVNYCAGMTAEQLTVDSATIVLEDRDRLLDALRDIIANLDAMMLFCSLPATAEANAKACTVIARNALGDR